jgi:blue light- and temperature-responsive anti-repressor
MRLHRLLYASRIANTLTAHRLESAVAQILEASQRNNALVGVTGLLLVHDGWFVQTLEGSEAAVRTVYGRISGDRRHYDLAFLGAESIEARAFGDWAMSARTLSVTDDAIGHTLGMKDSFNPARAGAGAMLKLLTAVRAIKTRSSSATPLAGAA